MPLENLNQALPISYTAFIHQRYFIDIMIDSTLIKKNVPLSTAPYSTIAKVTDLSYLKMISENDKHFMRDIIRVFNSNTPEAIIKAKSSLASKDWVSLAKTAHKLKPSVNIMGIKALKDPIQQIEDYARTEKCLDELPRMIGHLDETCRKAIQELENALRYELI